MKRSKIFLLGAVLGMLACGGDPAPGGGTGGNGGTGGSGGDSSQSHSYECCLDHNYFTCPSQAALTKCADLSRPDPSGCTPQPGPCPTSNGGSGGGGGGGAGGGGGGGGTGGSGGGGGGATSDIGKTCSSGNDCSSKVCLFKNGATYGYCTKECDSFSECPDFWDCDTVSNGSATYCIQH